MATPKIQSAQGALGLWAAPELVRRYLEGIQARDKPSGPGAGEWVELKQSEGSQPAWEHAKWLDGARLERVLGPEVLMHIASPELVDSPPAERVRAVLRRRGPFVALVDNENVFRALVDRSDLLEKTANQLGNEDP